ncbi:hypothetical protein BJX65DRAFT_308297 [Aspergillus insuetus]
MPTFLLSLALKAGRLLAAGACLCFTRRNSLFRIGCIPLILLTTWCSLETLRSFDSNEVVNTVAITWLVGYVLHHINILFTLPVDPSEINKNSVIRKRHKYHPWISLRAPFFRALNLALSLSGIGTSYEVTPIRRPQRPHETRARFLLRNLAKVCEKYIVLVIMTSMLYPLEERARLFGEGREYLLFRPHGLPRATTQNMETNIDHRHYLLGTC